MLARVKREGEPRRRTEGTLLSQGAAARHLVLPVRLDSGEPGQPQRAVLAHVHAGRGRSGQFNLGAYSIEAGRAGEADCLEIDNTKRQALIREAFRIHQDDIGHIPLHQQMLTWGMKQNVDLVQLANSFNYLRWITIR